MSRHSFLLVLILNLALTACASQSTVDLFNAVEIGDLTIASQALANQADINFARFSRRPLPIPVPVPPCNHDKGETPLSLAALTGNEAMVTLLIEKGANLDEPPNCTPLVMAVVANKPDIARILLAKGARVSLAALNVAVSVNRS